MKSMIRGFSEVRDRELIPAYEKMSMTPMRANLKGPMDIIKGVGVVSSKN